jgi:hypothetical protein
VSQFTHSRAVVSHLTPSTSPSEYACPAYTEVEERHDCSGVQFTYMTLWWDTRKPRDQIENITRYSILFFLPLAHPNLLLHEHVPGTVLQTHNGRAATSQQNQASSIFNVYARAFFCDSLI